MLSQHFPLEEATTFKHIKNASLIPVHQYLLQAVNVHQQFLYNLQSSNLIVLVKLITCKYSILTRTQSSFKKISQWLSCLLKLPPKKLHAYIAWFFAKGKLATWINDFSKTILERYAMIIQFNLKDNNKPLHYAMCNLVKNTKWW